MTLGQDLILLLIRGVPRWYSSNQFTSAYLIPWTTSTSAIRPGP